MTAMPVSLHIGFFGNLFGSFCISNGYHAMMTTDAHNYFDPLTYDEKREWARQIIDNDEICLVAEYAGTLLGYIHLIPFMADIGECCP